jgi:hypothetical protein
MSNKQLIDFAYAMTALIDGGAKEKSKKMVKRLKASSVVQYLAEEYGAKYPELESMDQQQLSEQLLAAYGGDAERAQQDRPEPKNGLALLLNLALAGMEASHSD